MKSVSLCLCIEFRDLFQSNFPCYPLTTLSIETAHIKTICYKERVIYLINQYHTLVV